MLVQSRPQNWGGKHGSCWCCRCWCDLLLQKLMLPIDRYAATCCGGMAAASLRLTLPPWPLLGCRRYAFAVFSFFYRFSLLSCCRISPLSPSTLEASPAGLCLLPSQTHPNHSGTGIKYFLRKESILPKNVFRRHANMTWYRTVSYELQGSRSGLWLA